MNRHARDLLSTTAPFATPLSGVIVERWGPPPKLESLQDVVAQAQNLKGMIALHGRAKRFVTESEAEAAKLAESLAAANLKVREAEAVFEAAEQALENARHALELAEEIHKSSQEAFDDHLEMRAAAEEILQNPDFRDAALAAGEVVSILKPLL